MTDAVTADRRTLISEVLVEDGYALVMRKTVLVEAGQRYWVDLAGSCLVVEGADGAVERFPGDAETRCGR